MADGVSADQMADLFGRVFHMVGSAFDCLCHGNYVNAVGTTESHFRFKASHYDQIVQTVSLAVGAQNFQCAGMIARGEGLFGFREHPREHREHVAEVAKVLRVKPGVNRVRTGREHTGMLSTPGAGTSCGWR